MTTVTPVEAVNIANDALDKLNIDDMDWRIEIVPLNDIYLDKYQRPLDERWLRARENDFRPWLLGTITLSERHKSGKRFANVDGQHRAELARRHGVSHLAAVVFYNLTRQQEAGLFSAFQLERRNITPFQRFNADLINEKPDAKAIYKIITDEGWKLQDANHHAGGMFIKAVKVMEDVYKEDPAQLRVLLRLLRETWGELPHTSNERFMRGVWRFLREVPDLDEARFIEKLGSVTPSTLFDRATNLREGRGAKGSLPAFVAEAVENQYRTRRR